MCLLPYIKNTCFSIQEIPSGYIVFTIKTQHFEVRCLSELTVSLFEQKIEKQKQIDVVTKEFFNTIEFEHVSKFPDFNDYINGQNLN